MREADLLRRIDDLEEGLARLMQLLPGEEDLCAFLKLRRDLEPVEAAERVWALTSLILRRRGIHESFASVRQLVEELRGEDLRQKAPVESEQPGLVQLIAPS